MKFKVGEKELNIKFGYKPILKERIISRLIKLSSNGDEDNGKNLEKIEDMLLFLPELILVGLQVSHKDEYGYNYDTKEGKEEQLNKVFNLVDEYSLEENADLMELYNQLQTEMMNDSFLASLFRQGKRAETVEDTVQPQITVVN